MSPKKGYFQFREQQNHEPLCPKSHKNCTVLYSKQCCQECPECCNGCKIEDFNSLTIGHGVIFLFMGIFIAFAALIVIGTCAVLLKACTSRSLQRDSNDIDIGDTDHSRKNCTVLYSKQCWKECPECCAECKIEDFSIDTVGTGIMCLALGFAFSIIAIIVGIFIMACKHNCRHR
ncbi:hypothetical protein CAEBREN_20489 [Caenorhabditis brenneri]|uniref:Uncharacterized protein n=1 Tax=Caenorhabditis brenneri TaxID=135651 RepID=G0PBS0_CAEBE|nr:hypothetical protein CAEBREN_20489 [Caenorhabditis brenneri]